MKPLNLIRFTILIVMLHITSHANAQVGYQPATFKNGAQDIAGQITFPKHLDAPLTVVVCRLLVGQDGDVYANVCQNNQLSDRELSRIEKVFSRARMQPAMVDSRTLSVLQANYSVYFINDDGNKSVVVTENLGLNIDQYGDHYIAPQVYNYPIQDDDELTVSCRGSEPAYTTMIVSVKGTASDFEFHPAISKSSCHNRLTRYYQQAKFIPAKSQGRFVEARHVLWFVAK